MTMPEPQFVQLVGHPRGERDADERADEVGGSPTVIVRVAIRRPPILAGTPQATTRCSLRSTPTSAR